MARSSSLVARRLLRAALIACGTAAVVGSGGAPGMSDLSSSAPVAYSRISTVRLEPERVVVQAGDTVRFSAGVSFDGTLGSQMPPYAYQ